MKEKHLYKVKHQILIKIYFKIAIKQGKDLTRTQT